MREQTGFAEHEITHGLKIMESGFVSQPAQGFAHFRKREFGFIAEAEKSLGASHLLARSHNRHYLVGGHGVCACLARISSEGAVATVIATEVRERNKNLARIGHDPRLEALPGFHCSRKQRRKFLVGTADQMASGFSRKGNSGAQLVRIRIKVPPFSPSCLAYTHAHEIIH